MNVGGGGNLFDLQASLSIDTGSFESDIDSAISSANNLSDAISNISDGADISINATDNTDGVVGDIADQLETVDEGADADISADTGTSVEDIGEVTDALNDVGDSAESDNFSISEIANTIKTVLAGSAVIAAIGKVKSAMDDMINSTVTSADTIDKQSQAIGISRKAYQEWDYIMQINGTSMSASGAAFRTLTNNVADGSSKFKTALKTVGLSYKEIAAMSTEDAFAAIVTAMQGMDDSDFTKGLTKQSVAMDLLGNRATALIPLLESTADSTEDLRSFANDSGMILSDDEIKNATDYADAMTTFNGVVDGLKSSIIVEILPAMTEILSAATGIVAAFTNNPTLTDNIDKIGVDFVNAISDINGTDLNLTAILDQLVAFANMDSLTEEQMAEWQKLIGQLKQISPELAAQFDSQTNSIKISTEELYAHKDALIADMKAQALASAEAARMEELAKAAEKLTNARVEAALAQNKADAMEKNQVANFEKLVSLYGLTSDQQKEMMRDAELLVGSDPTEKMLKATEFLQSGFYGSLDPANKAAADMYAEQVTGIDKAKAEADKLNKTLDEQQKEYDSVSEETQLWLETLESLMTLDTDTFSKDFTDNMSKITKSLGTGAEKVKAFEKIWNGINLKTIAAKVNATSTGGNVVGDKLSSILPFDTGIDFVPYDQLALIHKGEAVLTKLEANNWRNGEGTGASMASVAAMASVIAEAVSNRPVSFSVSSRGLSTAIATDSVSANAARTARIQSGYGRG